MATTSLALLRREYRNKPLLESQAPSDPLRLFEKWFREALKVKAWDVNAMTLATISPGGQPSARVVLLKGYDRKGFVFFTNYLSHKGRDLERHSQASLLFFWPELSRQIRLDGSAHKVATWESDEYFQTRPRDSQLGAWVSEQSRTLQDRKVLEQRMKEFTEKFRDQAVPRPPHWGGYRLVPRTIEFWKGQPSRLHDRLVYRKKAGDGWKRERLAP